jgi:hypothetical protein
MTVRPPLPDELREAVGHDLEPVRPLPRPAARTLLVTLWAVAVLVIIPALLGMRHDAKVLGFMLSWGVSGLESTSGLVLVWMALREAIPGWGVSRGAGIAALAAAVLILVGSAVLTWARLPSTGPLPDAAVHGAECFSMESLFGVPALVLTLWLVVRAFPVRPAWAGLLGGAGAGMLADGLQHLLCGIPDLHHVLVWHGGAATFLALMGWVVGRLWERRRMRG